MNKWIQHEHFSIYGLISWTFFMHLSFTTRKYVLISGIFRPALFTSFIVVFLAILSCFPFQTNWKHIFWTSFTKLSGGSGSKIHKWISFDGISDFSIATLPIRLIVLSDQILNSFFKFVIFFFFYCLLLHTLNPG